MDTSQLSADHSGTRGMAIMFLGLMTMDMAICDKRIGVTSLTDHTYCIQPSPDTSQSSTNHCDSSGIVIVWCFCLMTMCMASCDRTSCLNDHTYCIQPTKDTFQSSADNCDAIVVWL